jgi:hypothetical protein
LFFAAQTRVEKLLENETIFNMPDVIGISDRVAIPPVKMIGCYYAIDQWAIKLFRRA